MPTLYDILQLEHHAGIDQVKKSYKELAKKYHPDRNRHDPDAEDKFKEINNAYQILSDPDKKAQYDLLMLYAGSLTDDEKSQAVYRDQARRRRYYQPHSRADRFSEENLRVNRIANLWAIGIMVCVTLIFGIIVLFVNYNQELERVAVLEEREAIFQAAKQFYAERKYRASLDLLSYYPVANKGDDFKAEVLADLANKSNSSLAAGDHAKALYYMELIHDYSEYVDPALLYQMAQSYKLTENYTRAIDLLKEITEFNRIDFDAHLEIAELYRTRIRNDEEALRYYRKGLDLEIKTLENQYGKAFSAFLSSKYIPQKYFVLQIGLCQTYLNLGRYEEALESSGWAERIRKNDPVVYEIRGHALYGMKQRARACKELAKAQKYGSIVAEGLRKKYCM